VGKGDKQQVVKLKNGSHVDPESGLEEIAHVYRNKHTDVLYNTVLNLVDIKLNKNSYYKIQVLEADFGNKFWLFRAWGRIGTKIGDTETESHLTIESAIFGFERYFEEHTGNKWGVPFKKLPGKYAMIVVDYMDDEKIRQMDQKTSIPSNLQPPVQDLMKMIFDVVAMKNTMIQFELDLEKMPLGRLSKKQLEEAYACLNQLDILISEGADYTAFIGASNKFFSLIPHNFGMNSAPIINTVSLNDIKYLTKIKLFYF
jgi:poly [ADP-ribose] polymerase